MASPLERRRDIRDLNSSRERFSAYMRARLGDRFAEIEDAPFPPSELLLQTTASNTAEFQRRFTVGSYPARYKAHGLQNWIEWFGYLEANGFDLRQVHDIFELGCGTAPMLRHLRGIRGARLVASDVNDAMVEWCRANVPGPTYHRNELSPPLGFAEDQEFDFAFAYSVFTHIPLAALQPWIDEMRRILRPGGWFFCSVLGKRHQDRFLSPGQISQLKSKGRFEIGISDGGASLSTQVGGSRWDTYQTPEDIEKTFGAAFEIRAMIETRNQDVLILRRA